MFVLFVLEAELSSAVLIDWLEAQFSWILSMVYLSDISLPFKKVQNSELNE